jgi:hypothetical protein
MEVFDRERAAGQGQAQAMRAATFDAADQATLNEMNGPTVWQLDAALEDGAAMLAESMRPKVLRQLQQEWEDAGQVLAANAAGLLLHALDRADRHRDVPRSAWWDADAHFPVSESPCFGRDIGGNPCR